VTSSVSSRDAGDPDFDGYYVTAAYVLSGEHRPYDRKAGYARRVMPQGRGGAWELMARYGRVDLDDQAVRGGVMDGWWAGRQLVGDAPLEGEHHLRRHRPRSRRPRRQYPDLAVAHPVDLLMMDFTTGDR
jgi:hypothetical protein